MDKCENCRGEPDAVAYCNTCQKHICQVCINIHKQWIAYETHDIKMHEISMPQLLPNTPAECTEHRNGAVTQYCDTCSTLLCSKCDGHSGHETDTIEAKCLTKRDEIDAALTKVRAVRAKQLVESITKTISTVKRQHIAITSKVEETATEVIEKKKCEYLDQACAMERDKITRLEKQKQMAEEVELKSIEFTKHTEEILKQGTQAEILANTTNILQAFKNIDINQNQILENPETEANMVFLGSGNAFMSGAVVSLTCTVSERSAKVNEETIVRCTIKARTCEGVSYSGDFGELTTKLVNIKSKSITKCTVMKHQSEFEVRFTPTERGRHTLVVEINEQEVQGSPFTITVQPNISTLGVPVKIMQVENPWGITTTSKNHIVVAETKRNLVVKLDNEYQRETIVVPFGDQIELRGVAVDNDENFYVVVRDQKDKHHKICKIGNGTVQPVGNESQFERPVGIGFNKANGRLYVCDMTTVQILGTNLSILGTFGQFENCIDVAFDSTGNIYVTDYKKSSIQVFDIHNSWIREIKSDKFEEPYGIAIDSCDYIYVTERGKPTSENFIHIFTEKAEYLRSFGTHGSNDGQFKHPWGIHIDQDNFVLVSDNDMQSDKNRIYIF